MAFPILPVLATAAKTAGSWIAAHPVQAAGIAADAVSIVQRHQHKKQTVKTSCPPQSTQQVPSVADTTESLQQQLTSLEATVRNQYTDLSGNISQLSETADMLSYAVSDLEFSFARKLRVMGVLLGIAYVALIAMAVALVLFLP